MSEILQLNSEKGDEGLSGVKRLLDLGDNNVFLLIFDLLRTIAKMWCTRNQRPESIDDAHTENVHLFYALVNEIFTTILDFIKSFS